MNFTRAMQSFASVMTKMVRPISLSNRIQKSVFISQSNDVYTNLALEQWIAKNYDLEKQNIMLFYKNSPTIIVGTNGNPWLDVNEISSENADIPMARKFGYHETMYQDSGVMNITFFENNSDMNNDYNMNIISRGIFRRYGLKIEHTNENSHSFYNMKISTSNQFSNDLVSYHNCSLLVNLNKDVLLHQDKDLSGKQFLNLSEIDNRINIDGLLQAIGWEYLRTHTNSLIDGGTILANQQNGFQMINPTEAWCKGLNTIRENLSSWEHCYGSTPRFSVVRAFSVPGSMHELHVKLSVSNGIIEEITLFIPPGLSSTGFSGKADVVTCLKGQRYDNKALHDIEKLLGLRKVTKESHVDERARLIVSSI